MKHELAKLADIPETGSLLVPFFGREVHLYRVNGAPRAVANACLHINGPLECRDGKFVCAWHGATFAMEDGARIDGPASKGSRLMTLPTCVEGDGFFYVWGKD
jgi:nitrite reductase/ring-hydroxylating ferredoxin subunit